MTELSPAPQAAIDAWWNASDGEYIDGVWTPNRSAQLAAALETVADQLLPEPDYWDEDNMSQQGLLFLRLKRAQLLAIAAELLGTTTNQEG